MFGSNLATVLILPFTLAGALRSQEDEPAPATRPPAVESKPAKAESKPAKEVLAVRAGFIHTMSGPVIEQGVILIRDGKIEAIGKDVAIPEGARLLDLGSAHVMPGLVDPMSGLFVDDQSRQDASVDAGTKAADGLDLFDRDGASVLEHGITTVYVSATGPAAWSGQGAVLKITGATGEGTVSSRVVRDSAGVGLRIADLAPGTSNLSRSQLGEALRTALKAVEPYQKEWDAYKKAEGEYVTKRKDWLGQSRRPGGDGAAAQSRPGRTAGEGQGRRGTGGGTPEQQQEMRRRMQERGGTPGGGRPEGGTPGSGRPEGAVAADTPASQPASRPSEKPKPPKRPNENRATEALARVLKGELPLRLEVHRADEILQAIQVAEEFKIKDLILVQATEGAAVAPEIGRAGAAVVCGPLAQPHRRPAHLAAHSSELPALLARKGVPVALSGGGTDSCWLALEAAMAAGAGMDPEEALRSVTLEPARMLGVADRVGSLEAGKDADLVVFSGPPLASDSKVLRVLVDGKTAFEVK